MHVGQFVVFVFVFVFASCTHKSYANIAKHFPSKYEICVPIIPTKSGNGQRHSYYYYLFFKQYTAAATHSLQWLKNEFDMLYLGTPPRPVPPPSYFSKPIMPVARALAETTTLAGILPCIMLIRYTGGLFEAYAMYAVAGGFLAAVTGPNVKSVLMWVIAHFVVVVVGGGLISCGGGVFGWLLWLFGWFVDCLVELVRWLIEWLWVSGLLVESWTDRWFDLFGWLILGSIALFFFMEGWLIGWLVGLWVWVRSWLINQIDWLIDLLNRAPFDNGMILHFYPIDLTLWWHGILAKVSTDVRVSIVVTSTKFLKEFSGVDTPKRSLGFYRVFGVIVTVQ